MIDLLDSHIDVGGEQGVDLEHLRDVI